MNGMTPTIKKCRIYAVITILILSSNFFLFETSQTKDNKSSTPSENVNIENSKILNEQKIKQNLANMKGFFTKNEGQLENDEIYFTYSSQDKTFGFSESSVLIKLTKKLDDNVTKSSIIELTFENSNKVIPKGIKELSHKNNYFIGNDSSKWKRNVLNYEKILYENLYDGIDLVYYFNEKGLKYDWVVKAGADPGKIIERFEGIDSLKIDVDGRLFFKTIAGELQEEEPYSYQKIYGNLKEIDVRFRLIRDNKITYEIGDYDSSKNLIIDPLILNYSTFVGGSGGESGESIEIDTENNVYVTGNTESSDFQTTPGCLDDSYNGSTDIFVFKLNSNGSNLVYSTFIGGENGERSCGLSLDSDNNVYITGETESTNFPTTQDCFNSTHNGENGKVFVLKLNSVGSSLLYSTFIGGSDSSIGNDIVIDFDNNTYITGYTQSLDFPTTTGCFDNSLNGTMDVFVLKLNSDGSDLLYSTYIGGSNFEGGKGIAIDSNNNAYITGGTDSSNFPTTLNCFDDLHNGNYDVFVLKLNSDGSDLIYSTFVGGGGTDHGTGGIALDSENNTYITGYTTSLEFPTTPGCYDNSYNGDYDVFIFKLNKDGSDLIYSTFVSEKKDKENYDMHGYSITIDSDNNAYITGRYNQDLFVFKLNHNGSSIHYNTFLRGSGQDIGYGITLDSDNNVYVTGYTASSNFPTTQGCFDSYLQHWEVFVFKLVFNLNPKAIIESISKNYANESETIYFYGNGTDEGTIEGYEWYSGIDGIISVDKSFSLSNLSNGTHTISLKVKDNYDVWSEEVSSILIINGNPRAKIDEIKPTHVNEGEFIRFYGNGTDDGKIKEYYWYSNINGILSRNKSFSLSNLSNGTHTISFKVIDNNNTWSEEVNFSSIYVNGIPRAKIENINPNPANENVTIWFYGGENEDRTIQKYYWLSSIKGYLSDKKSFNISNLSNGTHKIYYKIQDDCGIWSKEVYTILIINGIPRAKILNIGSNQANEGEKIWFYGKGTDDGTIEEYNWYSDIDGFLSNKDYFGFSNLSNGTHSILFKVKDNNNTWSKKVSMTLSINGIPRAKITEIKPNPIEESKTVWFFGKGMDDGTIEKFVWRSSIDGEIHNGSSSKFNTDTLSLGLHTIFLKVQDNHGIWSDEVSDTLAVYDEGFSSIIEYHIGDYWEGKTYEKYTSYRTLMEIIGEDKIDRESVWVASIKVDDPFTYTDIDSESLSNLEIESFAYISKTTGDTIKMTMIMSFKIKDNDGKIHNFKFEDVSTYEYETTCPEIIHIGTSWTEESIETKKTKSIIDGEEETKTEKIIEKKCYVCTNKEITTVPASIFETYVINWTSEDGSYGTDYYSVEVGELVKSESYEFDKDENKFYDSLYTLIAYKHGENFNGTPTLPLAGEKNEENESKFFLYNLKFLIISIAISIGLCCGIFIFLRKRRRLQNQFTSFDQQPLNQKEDKQFIRTPIIEKQFQNQLIQQYPPSPLPQFQTIQQTSEMRKESYIEPSIFKPIVHKDEISKPKKIEIISANVEEFDLDVKSQDIQKPSDVDDKSFIRTYEKPESKEIEDKPLENENIVGESGKEKTSNEKGENVKESDENDFWKNWEKQMKSIDDTENNN